MITNQNQFMKTIRSALGKPADKKRSAKQFPQLLTSPDCADTLAEVAKRSREEQLELIELLQENAKTINLQTHIVGSESEAADVIVDLIRTRSPEFNHAKHVIMHDHPDLAALGLWKRFTREAVTTHTSFPTDRDLKEKTCASFIGITAPFLGVADSATVIEVTSPGRPRSISLVPSIHIAFLRRKRLVADLSEAFALLAHGGLPDSFVCISGPSKTADIEAHMVHGAHGPREMHLVLLSDAQPELQEPPSDPSESRGSADGKKEDITPQISGNGASEDDAKKPPSTDNE
ncbi:MAG: LutC/YkgG family protein [Desulforhopalus sp.]